MSYARMGGDGLTPCYYCGLPADSIDHVVPQTLLSRLELNEDLREELGYLLQVSVVAACRQCNAMLGDRVFRTLWERRRYVKERIRFKYRRLLRTPNWAESELCELGFTLGSFVRGRKNLKEIVLARLRWPNL